MVFSIFRTKEIIMAKRERLVIAGNAKGSAKAACDSAKESTAMRALRIDGSCNGRTLRTRVIRNKKLYNRNFKHKKSFADAGDFPFFMDFFFRTKDLWLSKQTFVTII